jgi:glutathione reductase (NADPH)
MPEYDVVVIGSGTAAQNVAPRCAQARLRVAVVDRLPYGGTCGLRGCDPKKVLLAAAEAVSRARGLGGRGLAGAPAIDWPALIARKRTFTEPVPERIEGWMRGAGAETLHGTARLLGAHEVEVDGRAFDAADVVVASGARPVDLGIPGEESVTTSTGFLELEHLPPRVVVIGGGYISFEFAWLSRMAGAAVTILHRGQHVLKGFDEQLADMLVERYRSLGIEVVTGAPVHEIHRHGDELVVVHAAGELATDLVVHGAGRVADIDDLGLAAAGIEAGRRGVRVDARLRSVSDAHVWAAGDAADKGLPLTPVASKEGKVVAAGILGEDAEYDGRAVPSVCFSDPPLAAVGMSTAEAAGKGDAIRVLRADTSEWFTQRRLGQTHGGAALVTDASSGRLLGGHILGVNADAQSWKDAFRLEAWERDLVLPAPRWLSAGPRSRKPTSPHSEPPIPNCRRPKCAGDGAKVKSVSEAGSIARWPTTAGTPPSQRTCHTCRPHSSPSTGTRSSSRRSRSPHSAGRASIPSPRRAPSTDRESRDSGDPSRSWPGGTPPRCACCVRRPVEISPVRSSTGGSASQCATSSRDR